MRELSELEQQKINALVAELDTEARKVMVSMLQNRDTPLGEDDVITMEAHLCLGVTKRALAQAPFKVLDLTNVGIRIEAARAALAGVEK